MSQARWTLGCGAIIDDMYTCFENKVEALLHRWRDSDVVRLNAAAAAANGGHLNPAWNSY